MVGAGGAGVSAAIEAAARGARVAVIEAAAEIGGTARTAGAGTCIAGSAYQARHGIHDSPEMALEDWVACGGDSVDVEWAGRYLEASVPEIYAGLAELGVEWVSVHQFEGNRVARWHAVAGGGRAVMAALERVARGHRSIAWHTNSRVRDLTVSGGRVVGVTVEGPAGETELRAASVLLATGGFSSNLSMVRAHAAAAASAERVLLGGGRGARGDGHGLLQAVGAAFVNLDAVWMYPYGTPDPDDPEGVRGLAVRDLDGEVWVNQEGQRFHNEALRGGASGTVALLAQRPATCWAIIDARSASRFSVSDPGYRIGTTPLRHRLQRLLERSPFVARAQSVEELGMRIGVDHRQLGATIRTHNERLASGLRVDPDFGRPLAGLEPLEAPPFSAIQFFPLARKNLGGVRTDLDCRVLDDQGRAVPGLFAAGEVAGMAGGHLNGRAALEGTMFGPSLFSGRVAGRCATA